MRPGVHARPRRRTSTASTGPAGPCRRGGRRPRPLDQRRRAAPPGPGPPRPSTSRGDGARQRGQPVEARPAAPRALAGQVVDDLARSASPGTSPAGGSARHRRRAARRRAARSTETRALGRGLPRRPGAVEAADQHGPPAHSAAARRATGSPYAASRRPGLAGPCVTVSRVVPGSSAVPSARTPHAAQGEQPTLRPGLGVGQQRGSAAVTPETASGCHEVTGRLVRPADQLDDRLRLARRRTAESATCIGRATPSARSASARSIAAPVPGRSPGRTRCTSRARSARAVTTAPSRTRCGRVSARACPWRWPARPR